MTEKHVQYRPIEEDIICANYRRTKDNLMVMQGEPSDVTNDAIRAVAEHCLALYKKGYMNTVTINGEEYCLIIKKEADE